MGTVAMTPGQFTRIAAGEYICFTWFERDRANIRLETPNGREVFDL
jgi:urease accessory protein UreE